MHEQYLHSLVWNITRKQIVWMNDKKLHSTFIMKQSFKIGNNVHIVCT